MVRGKTIFFQSTNLQKRVSIDKKNENRVEFEHPLFYHLVILSVCNFFFFHLITQSIFEKMKSFGQQTDTFCGKINFRSSFLELKNKQGISDSV